MSGQHDTTANVCARCGRSVPPKTRGFSQVRPDGTIVSHFPLCGDHRFIARDTHRMLDVARTAPLEPQPQTEAPKPAA